MSVMKFILFSVTLKTSSASPVFSDFAWPLLLSKQSSKTWSRRIEKKEMTLFIQFFYKRKFYERTLQVEFPVISLLSKNAMPGQTAPNIDEIYQ